MLAIMGFLFCRRWFVPAPGLAWAALQAKANQGDAEAQFSLGLRYSNAGGEGLDFAEAARWYRKAAEQDHVLAQYNLAVMLARGQGVAQDDAVATCWFRKSAEGGDAGGQHELGVRCHRASLDRRPLGAVDSRIEAYKWLHLAAGQGYKDSLTACQTVSLTMSRGEVDEGNQRAAAFVARVKGGAGAREHAETQRPVLEQPPPQEAAAAVGLKNGRE